MGTRDGFSRMDVDTGWAYDRKMRELQRLYPDTWPAFVCAYLGLLGEAWSERSRRVALEDAWVPALPCSLEDATTALVSVDLIDSKHRITTRAWAHWFKPAEKRVSQRKAAGEAGAAARWHSDGNATASQSQWRNDAPSQPASQPRQPARVAPAREGLNEAERAVEELTGLVMQRIEPTTIRELNRAIDQRGAQTVAGWLRLVAPGIQPQPPAARVLVFEAIRYGEPIGQRGKQPKGRSDAKELQRAVEVV